jgi:hypothetical protein
MDAMMQISHKKYQIFSTIIALTGFVFAIIATSKYGAGVSSDAVRNLSTADNLAAGNGFFDFVRFPFVQWPPLYPLTLAGLKLLTGLGTFQIAWYLNVFLYLVNLWLWSELLYRIFQDRPVYAVLGAVAMVLSRSTLRIYDTVTSEPMFITFMLVFFFAAADYLNGTSRRGLWFMILMAALASLQRYLGVILIGILGLLILYRHGWRAIGWAFLSTILAFLPIGLWVFLHNYLRHNMLFGPRVLSQFFPLENISLTLTKMFNWFVPLHPLLLPLLMRPWIILLVIALILVLINDRKRWLEWVRAFTQNRNLSPLTLFTIIYLILLAFTVNTIDHRDLTSDRYYVVVYPAILVIIFITVDRLVLTHIDLGNRWLRAAPIALFLIWLLYPVASLQEYLGKALVQGEPSNYNIHNSAWFANMQFLKVTRTIIDQDPSAMLYSNYTTTTWFRFQRPTYILPHQDAELSLEENLALLERNYADWPGADPGYIIWFTPNESTGYAPPENLSIIANVKLLYQDENGQLFYVEAKK